MHRSSRVSKLPTHLNEYEVILNCSAVRYPIQSVCVVNSALPISFICLMSNLYKVSELACVKNALNDPRWKRAMDNEMNALIKTNT